MRQYNITLAEYDAMFMSQGQVCVICHTDNPGAGRSRFSVDHDHETGKVRGLLCHGCNIVLGMVKDKPKILRDAAGYLEYHGAIINA